jgi:VCBS repeat-containing protein
MATSTDGGTTASFLNSPQAVDDYYAVYEDCIYSFDVMSNDLGGSAKILWSIDDSTMTDDSSSGTYDLLSKDAACVPELSDLGARIWIESGKIRYDASVFNYLGAGQSVCDKFTYAIRLSNGTLSWATVAITISGTNDGPDIRVGSGDSGSESLNETNSGLCKSGTLTVTDPDTSDTISTSIALTSATGPTGGPSNAQLLAMLSITPDNGLAANAGDTNNLTWKFDSGSEAFNYLRAGQSLQLVYTLTVNDGHGGTDTQTVAITVTGTNDAPVLSDTINPSAVAELSDASAQNLSAITGNFSVTDLDVGDTLDASVVGGATVLLDGNPFVLPVGASALTAAGAFSVTDTVSNGGAVNIGYSYDPAAANLDFLRAGQSLTITYTVQVNDGTTNSATQDVTFTITGTNDAPILSDTTDPSAVLELADASAQNLSAITGNFSVTDLDVGDTLDASVVGGATVLLNGNPIVLPADASALTAAGAFTVTDTVSNGGAVNIGYSYDPGAANLDFLAVGQSLTITYTVQVSDGTTNSATQDVTFTITGTNDAPDIRVEAGDSASDSLSETNAELTTTGTLTVTDVDTSDQVSTSISLTNVTGNQGSLSDGDLEAMLSVTPDSGLDANTGDANNLTWSFDSDGEAFNYLAPGQSLQLTYTLTVSDGNGGTDTQAVTVTVTGTNDAPVLTGDLAATVAEGVTYQLTTADVNFTDPDDSAANVTFTVTGLSNGTLYVNGIAGNSFTGAQLAAGLVTFTHDGSETTTAGFSISVEDGNEDVSAPVAQPFNFTVTPVNDAPVNTVPGGQSVNEDQTLVFSTGNGNAISIGDVDAGSNNVQVALSVASGTLTLGALTGLTVTAGANGTSTLTVQGTLADINAALQGLTYQGNLNFNGGDSLSIVTSDLGNSGSGGALTDSDSVAITINAVNDAPVNNTPASFSTNEDNAFKLAGLSVTDVDAGAGGISVTLSVASGTLSAADASGVTVSGSGSGSITLSGALAAINTYLATVANQPTFTPVANANGAVTLTMTTSDGGNAGSGGAQSDTDNVTITINAVNDAPVASPVTLAAIAEDSGPRIITQAELLAGVTDIDGPSLSISALSIATGGGSLISNGNGTWTYTPALDDDTSVTFTYTASDGSLTSNSTATMDITPVADGAPPTDITFTLVASTGSLVGNGINSGMTLGSLSAVDPDSSSWTFTIGSVAGQSLPAVTATPGTGGTVNLVTSGAIAAGNYQFTVTATDATGQSFTETYTLSVGTTNGDTSSFFTITTGTDISLGLNGGDTINGGAGDDALVGGANVDTLNGGLGNDQLLGGAAGDNFLFNTALNGTTNVDRILDFDAGGGPSGDHIQLDDAIFTQLSVGTLSAANFASNAGGNATDANDYILYDTATGNLYYDADGNGAGAKVLFATLTVSAGTIDPTDILIV